MLCDLCQRFCCDVLTGAVDQEGWHPSRYRDLREFHFNNVERMRTFALSGQCGLCSLFYEHYQDVERYGQCGLCLLYENYQDVEKYSFAPPPGQQVRLTNQTPVILHLPNETRFEARPWQFRFGEPGHNFEFCFFDPLKRHPQADITDLDVTIAKRVEPYIGTRVEDYAGSDAVCTLSGRWSSHCLAGHARCHDRNRKKLLPRRVIDVGEANSEGSWSPPRIMQSDGQYGYYITLSYRWSAVGTQFCTTRENYADLMKFLPLWRLPKTIQDGIDFCRRLGYRYLWVDSLCIIQGDDGDWNEACHRMASIFENSHLTISALRSKDSHAGLFHYRKYKELSNCICLRLRDGRLLTLRLSEPGGDLHYAVNKSPMNSRGWIMQEKLLSPAIVHFGERGLYWECKCSTVSEAFANVEVSGEGSLKNMLAEVQRPGCSHYPGGHFIAWYMIMMRYSQKSLTFEADRLPAILGLATRFQKTFSTTFIAGLWLEDLHRGLLWNSTAKGLTHRTPAPTEPPGNKAPPRTDVIAPSWSWLSMTGNGFVEFEIRPIPAGPALLLHPVERLISYTDASFVDVKVKFRPHTHPGTVQGAIKLWGTVMHVEAFPSEPLPNDASGPSRFNIRKRNSTHLTRRWPSPRYKGSRVTRCLRSKSERIVEDPELPIFLDAYTPAHLDYYCLVVADWRFEDGYKKFFNIDESTVSRPELRCYLVLKQIRIRGKHRHPLDLGLFKRVGMGAARVDVVEHFFGSSSKEKKFLTIQ